MRSSFLSHHYQCSGDLRKNTYTGVRKPVWLMFVLLQLLPVTLLHMLLQCCCSGVAALTCVVAVGVGRVVVLVHAALFVGEGSVLHLVRDGSVEQRAPGQLKRQGSQKIRSHCYSGRG